MHLGQYELRASVKETGDAFNHALVAGRESMDKISARHDEFGLVQVAYELYECLAAVCCRKPRHRGTARYTGVPDRPSLAMHRAASVRQNQIKEHWGSNSQANKHRRYRLFQVCRPPRPAACRDWSICHTARQAPSDALRWPLRSAQLASVTLLQLETSLGRSSSLGIRALLGVLRRGCSNLLEFRRKPGSADVENGQRSCA